MPDWPEKSTLPASPLTSFTSGDSLQAGLAFFNGALLLSQRATCRWLARTANIWSQPQRLPGRIIPGFQEFICSTTAGPGSAAVMIKLVKTWKSAI